MLTNNLCYSEIKSVEKKVVYVFKLKPNTEEGKSDQGI